MHSTKKKMSNVASAAKEKMTICQARAEEKAEKAVANTKEAKEIAHERRKAKEAQAKMELHEAKAGHAAHKLRSKQAHTQHLSGYDNVAIPHRPPMAEIGPGTPLGGHPYVQEQPRPVASIPPRSSWS